VRAVESTNVDPVIFEETWSFLMMMGLALPNTLVLRKMKATRNLNY